MTNEELRIYKRLRKETHCPRSRRNYRRSAKSALSATKTIIAFRELEGDECAKIEATPDDFGWSAEDLFGDGWDELSERQQKEIIDEYNSKGVWVVATRIRCQACHEWGPADACGAIVANNPCDPFDDDCGKIVIDLMAAAVRHYKEKEIHENSQV